MSIYEYRAWIIYRNNVGVVDVVPYDIGDGSPDSNRDLRGRYSEALSVSRGDITMYPIRSFRSSSLYRAWVRNS